MYVFFAEKSLSFTKKRYICHMLKITNEELGRLTVDEFAQRDRMPVVVVADNIRSSQNIGSLFRSCDAFAPQKICLCGISPTPPSRDIHKTALGAELTVAWEHHPSTLECVTELKAQGYTIVAIEQVEGAVMLNDFKPSTDQKYAIVLGNEVMGVEQAVCDVCDLAIEIPQVGTKHSLNVSVAGGVVLWQFFCTFTKY